MKPAFVFLLCLISFGAAAAEIPDAEQQIALASLASPEEERAACAVLGYDAEGAVVGLREGTNGLTCLADDPSRAGFSVACYPSELEPYMRRGRELRAEGKAFDEVFAIREAEVKSGQLEIPDRSVLNVLSGELDPDTGEVKDAYMRYVVYIPYATSESTGLPLQPVTPGGPWIMDPGTHRAHIMINPPR